MKKNIVIIHYNTPYLTECLVRSINLFVKDAIVYIFDNSDKEPFTAEFDNVAIIDNTKGQIIDFDKWLEKYPRRNSSNGKVNRWGSAKHCYSVEKCMDIIKEPFILLDSDVLLKKDISNLYREDLMYIGETATQPKSTIKRILPFICYINVKMCMDNNVHYFDENYMHGLYNQTIVEHGDWYDTGAGFYIHAKDFHHKDIHFNDYVVHYGHGSWDRDSENTTLTPIEWLIENKCLWANDTENNPLFNVLIFKQYKNDLKKYLKRRRPEINIDNPRTIQDKINWLKVNNVTQLKTDCADKIKIHEYCKEKLDKDICIPIIKIYNNTNEIKWDELPDEFVMKCNHGSGMNIIVKDKDKINKNDCIAKLNKWMKTDFAFQNGYEMQYHNIERKIFIEEYKNDGHKDLIDYKFLCFNGEPKIVQVIGGRNELTRHLNYYDINFNFLPISRIDFPNNPNINDKQPINFGKMIEYAKKLSEPFEFVRVDFYEVDGEVYLGELTFTPGVGFFKYKNNIDGLKIGNMLDLPIANNKKVVYTCITGGYDTLKSPSCISEGFDYICFTDNNELESDVWEIRPLPEDTKNLSTVKKQRYVKINAHKILSEYDLSIWVDGNINITDDLNDFVEKTIQENYSIYIPQHPQRDCIYKEANAVIKLKKDTLENVTPQIERYKLEGFPEQFGLPQSNIILRKHNNDDCVKLMETWWKEVENGSHRDQLSFNYACWKNPLVEVYYLDKKICRSKWFFWNALHTKSKKDTIKKINEYKESLRQYYKYKTNDIGLYR